MNKSRALRAIFRRSFQLWSGFFILAVFLLIFDALFTSALVETLEENVVRLKTERTVANAQQIEAEEATRKSTTASAKAKSAQEAFQKAVETEKPETEIEQLEAEAKRLKGDADFHAAEATQLTTKVKGHSNLEVGAKIFWNNFLISTARNVSTFAWVIFSLASANLVQILAVNYRREIKSGIIPQRVIEIKGEHALPNWMSPHNPYVHTHVRFDKDVWPRPFLDDIREAEEVEIFCYYLDPNSAIYSAIRTAFTDRIGDKNLDLENFHLEVFWAEKNEELRKIRFKQIGGKEKLDDKQIYSEVHEDLKKCEGDRASVNFERIQAETELPFLAVIVKNAKCQQWMLVPIGIRPMDSSPKFLFFFDRLEITDGNKTLKHLTEYINTYRPG